MEKNLILQKAQSAEMSHDFATAERMYKQLLDDDPSNVNYLKSMGGIFVQAGEDEKAIPYYEQIIAYYPHYIEAMNSLGAIYRRLKRYEESITILQRALEEDRQIPMVNYNLGFTYKEMGNYEDAIEAFNYVITANPNDVLAHNHLGSIYCTLKDYQKSIAAFKHGLQIDPNHPILNYNLARCYEASKNYPDAIRCYGLALKTKPGWTEAIQDFSRLLIKCQKNKEAQDTVEQAIKLHPDDVNMLMILGEVYINEFDYDNAIRTFKKVKSIDETNVKAISSLADAYDKAEMIPQATEELLTALDLDTENVNTKKLYINNLLSTGELDEAAFYLADLMNQNGASKDVPLLDLYGQYYICKGEDTKAEENFNKIKFVNHHYKDYLLHAARRYAQLEKYEKAEEYANKYVEQRPQNPDGFMSLGSIYEKKGDYIGAKNFFSKSVGMRIPNVLAKKKIAGLTDKLNDLDMYVPLQEIDPNELNEEKAEEVHENNGANENSEENNGDGFDFDQMGDSIAAEEDKKDDDYFEDLASNVEDKYAKEEEDDSFEIQDPDKMEFADEETAFSFDQTDEEKDPLKDDEGGNFFDDITPQDMAKMQEQAQDSAEDARDSAEFARGSADYAKDSAEFARGSADYAKDSAEVAKDSAQAAKEAAENARDLMNQLKEQQAMMQEQLMEQQMLMNEQMKQNAQNMVKEAVCDFLETPSPSSSPVEPVEPLEDSSPVEPVETPEEPLSVEPVETPEDSLSVEPVETPDSEIVETPDSEIVETPDSDFVETSVPAPVELPDDEPFATTDDLITDITEESSPSSPVEPVETPEDSLSVEPVETPEEPLSVEPVETPDTEIVAPPAPESDLDFDAEFENSLDDEGESLVIDAPENEPVSAETITQETQTDLSDILNPENITVEEMLDKIQKILQDDEMAVKNADKLELFKTLRILSNFLPESERNTFQSCRMRMMIEYIIAKLSGKPGLYKTTVSLIKSGVLGEEFAGQLTKDCDLELSNELIRQVITDMKKMAAGLEDEALAQSLIITADGILEQIELKNQQSAIF